MLHTDHRRPLPSLTTDPAPLTPMRSVPPVGSVAVKRVTLTSKKNWWMGGNPMCLRANIELILLFSGARRRGKHVECRTAGRARPQQLLLASPTSTAPASYSDFPNLPYAKKSEHYFLFSHPRYLFSTTQSYSITKTLCTGLCI